MVTNPKSTKKKSKPKSRNAPNQVDQNISADTISVVSRRPSRYLTGGMTKLSDYLYEDKPIKTDALREQINDFLTKMQAVIKDAPDTFGTFNLDAIELSAEISASGHVKLLGFGGEAAGKGGIKFSLKKVAAVTK